MSEQEVKQSFVRLTEVEKEIYRELSGHSYRDLYYPSSIREMAQAVAALPVIKQALELKKRIHDRLPNVHIVERCTDCAASRIISLQACPTCQDNGVVTRQATEEDILKILEKPTTIVLGTERKE